MATYDPEKEKTWKPPKADGSHDDLGTHPERREAEVADLEKQYGAPSAGEGDKASSGERSELDSLGEAKGDSDSGDWETNVDDESGGGKKRRFRVTGKQAAAGGGVAALLIGGSFGLFTLFSGPFQFIHIAQMLKGFHFGNNERFMDGRVRNLTRYMRNYGAGERYRNNLGRFSNKLADHYEEKLAKAGMRANYNDSFNGKPRGTIQSFDIDPDTPQGKKALAELDARGIKHEVANVDGKAMRRVELRGFGSTRESKDIIRIAFNATDDVGDVSSAMGKRLLKKRAGVDFHPLRNKVREARESLVDYYRARKEERAERRAKGSQDVDVKAPKAEEITDANGNKTTDAATREAAEEAERIVGDTNKVNPVGEEAVGKIANIKKLLSSPVAKTAGWAGAVVGVMCTARSLGQEAENVQYARVILPMIRIGMEFISIGSQIMSGKDVNLEELGSMSADLYDTTKDLPANKRSFFSAQSIQAEQGKKQTGPDIPESIKPSSIEEKPTWLEVLDKVPGLSQACGISDVFGDLPVIKQFGELTTSAITTLSGGLLEKAVELAINTIAGTTEIVNAKGAELGNIANYGTLMAANDSAISMGGRPLDTAEVVALDTDRHQAERQDLQDKSFFARMFDPYEKDSLVAKTALENPQYAEPSIAMASIFQVPLKSFSNLGSLMSNLLGPRLGAQEAVIYDYGIPEFGFSLDEINNPAYEDPFENADKVEGPNKENLQRLNDKYGKCFNTTIDSSGKIVTGEAKKYGEIAADRDCNSPSEEFIRYRFYIADTVAMATMTCYELNEGCEELGFGSTASTAFASTAGAQIEGDPFESSENIACAPGTNDLGVHTGYNSNNAIQYRLCGIPNIPSTSEESTPGSAFYIEGADGHVIVNSRVSGAVLAMAQAALADGVELTAASSFRTMEHQQSLYNANPNPLLVAPPGRSNHQAGTAIDFNAGNVKGGVTCSTRARAPGNAQWDWLFANAGRFGYQQYAKESWHWDPSTSDSRCGADS